MATMSMSRLLRHRGKMFKPKTVEKFPWLTPWSLTKLVVLMLSSKETKQPKSLKVK